MRTAELEVGAGTEMPNETHYYSLLNTGNCRNAVGFFFACKFFFAHERTSMRTATGQTVKDEDLDRSGKRSRLQADTHMPQRILFDVS